MHEIVRIGGGSVSLNDSGFAASRLISAGKLDYLILDYLAEPSVAALEERRGEAGGAVYVSEFVERVWAANIEQLASGGPKLVTNAGGLDPDACCRSMQDIAAASGISLDIVVAAGGTGDHARGACAGGIAAALAGGADIVITGIVSDAALTLGALIHAFGWRDDAFDALAGGALAGHIIECGAQAARGAAADWAHVPFWARGGYPIVECAASGAFVVGKLKGSAGQCTTATVAQQILYEVSDPSAHHLPCVTADYRDVAAVQLAPERVQVSGARGRPPGQDATAGSPPTAMLDDAAVGPSLADPVDVPLFDIAWGRLGDDGGHRTLEVVARRPEYLPFIRRAMTAETIAAFLAEESRSPAAAVQRFDLPGLDAISFLFGPKPGADTGGGSSGPGMKRLLDFPVAIPREAAVVLAG